MRLSRLLRWICKESFRETMKYYILNAWTYVVLVGVQLFVYWLIRDNGSYSIWIFLASWLLGVVLFFLLTYFQLIWDIRIINFTYDNSDDER